MERIAIFVEGQTERIFVENLLHAMAGPRNYHIDAFQAFGGGPILRAFGRRSTPRGPRRGRNTTS